MLNDSLIRFLQTLVVPPPDWGGMGATRLSLDPRDYPITRLPGVPEALAETPQQASLLELVKGVYNQGSYGACVAASTCSASSMDSVRNSGAWHTYDWLSLYREAGGTGSNGVDSRLVLQLCQQEGTPLQGGGREKEIVAYAFVPQQPGAFREGIKACIAAGYPAVLALLLPSDFGWQSGHGGVTSGYHQVACVAYDPSYVWILNSWSGAWPGQAGSPAPGVGSILWDFVESNGLQQGYAFSYVTTSANPNPPPPPPPPNVLLVTGYQPNPVASGQPFTIQGAGFEVGATAILFGERLPTTTTASNLLRATAPAEPATTAGTVTVSSGGHVAEGPVLTVTAGQPLPPPPPPGNLHLNLYLPTGYHGREGIFVCTVGSAHPPSGTEFDLSVRLPDGRAATAKAVVG